jgi:hypothetical protein
MRYWTNEEIQILKEKYPELGALGLVKILKRESSSISTKARRLNIRFCGCLHYNPKRSKDISGIKFGKLTVICYSHSNKGKKYWKCKCECGKEKITFTQMLTGGGVKSCGCLKYPIRNDYTGKRYGRWVVLQCIKKNDINRRTKYLCRCDCGTEKIMFINQLTGGNSKSCGCLHHEIITAVRYRVKKDTEQFHYNICNRWLLKSNFTKNKSNTYGIYPYCKECRSKLRREEWAELGKEKKTELYKKRKETLVKGPEYYQYFREYRKKNRKRLSVQRNRNKKLRDAKYPEKKNERLAREYFRKNGINPNTVDKELIELKALHLLATRKRKKLKQGENNG